MNASLIDQRIGKIVADYDSFLPAGADDHKRKSAAFVLLCMSTVLDLPIEEVADFLTEGAQDASIDGIHLGEVDDGEFTVTLFQGKYKQNLEGQNEFPENDIKKAINTISTIFDPDKHVDVNEKLKPKIEDVRSLVRDGYIPNVRMILCNNGLGWNTQSQTIIDNSGLSSNQVEWIHWNHDCIVSVMQRKKTVDETIQLSGDAVIEDFNFRRVLIGKVPVTEIAEIFNRHNDLLLERNIRRYLGLHSNRVNSAIHQTLTDTEKRSNFYFFNNGVTMICRKFRHNALQGKNYQVKIENLQIINGGQTCKTIQQTLASMENTAELSEVFVLVRIYELAEDDQDFVRDITYATNSQNPVDLRDLRSNDEIQRQLEIGISNLGFIYKRQREDGQSGSTVIPSTIVAESVLAIWRCMPHQAKFLRKEHFGALYSFVFNSLNAAQAVLAVLIYRYVDSMRKKSIPTEYSFIPYATHYLANVIGIRLIVSNGLNKPDQISHLNFSQLIESFDSAKDSIYSFALTTVSDALKGLYGDRALTLQQLSATFRRGDLLSYLPKHELKQ